MKNFSTSKRISKIYEYDFSGKFLSEYSSTSEIAEKYNISVEEINRGLQGKYKIKNHFYSLEKTKVFNFQPKIEIKNKKIFLYDISGKFVYEFETPISCARFFGLKSSSTISSALRLGRLFKGYQVSLEKVPFMKNYQPKNGKMIINQFDLKGKLIKTFPTLTEAIKKFGTGVRKVVRGQQKQCKGFIFKEANDIV